MANSNIINAVFGSGLCAVTTSAFRANYGMVLRFSGIDLPTAFEVDFSNYDVMGRDSITMIGQNGEVQIPDDLWDSGLNIYAYVYLHPTDDSGVTVYTVTIPVLGRPNRTEETPTPHEQTVIEQAISALNDAVEQTAADVVSADASAQAAAQSEANASASERAAAASASAALASQNAAESAAQGATESASGASESAQNAANSASQAAQSATSAQESAEQAELSVQSITDDVERAERAAQTATGKATEASASATAAAQSASSAASAAQNAASSATAAESHATDAETAKQAAQDAQEAAETAQAAAEQAAQSVSGLSAHIEQNTADIAELVLSKAGALVDTASGSIASFVPDATVPTVRGLTVDIEPQQDLHGYDHPWPSGGGGKNKLDQSAYTSLTNTTYADGTFTATSMSNLNGAFVRLFNGTTQVNTVSRVVAQGARTSLAITVDDTWDRMIIGYLMSAQNIGAYFDKPNVPNGEYVVSFTADVLPSSSVYGKFSNIQLESGTTATSYAPYSNICPISGWDEVEVQRTGVNVWDEEWEEGYYGSTGNPSGGSGYIRSKNYISVKPNEPYYCKTGNASNFCLQFYGADKAFLSQNFTWRDSVVTIPSDCYYLRFWRNETTYANNISINYPATDTAYHSGTGNATYQIQLGQTVYGGKIDAVNGVLTVDRANVLLTSQSGTWSKYVSRDFCYQIFVGNNKFANDSVVRLASDKYIGRAGYTPTMSQLETFNNGIYSADGNRIRVYDKRFSTLEDFLSSIGEGIQVVYELATPITVDLTPIEVAVLTGQTNNVWADSGDVSVEYAADLKTYINNKIAAAVAALS